MISENMLKSRGNGKLPRDTGCYHPVTSRYGVIWESIILYSSTTQKIYYNLRELYSPANHPYCNRLTTLFNEPLITNY